MPMGRASQRSNVRFVEVDVDTTAYEQPPRRGRLELDEPARRCPSRHRDEGGPGRAAAQSGIGPDTTIALYSDNNNLVRRLGVLAVEAVRAARRAHPQRRPQVLAGQRPAGDDGRPDLPADRHPARRPGLQLPAFARRPAAGRRFDLALVDKAGRVQRRGHRPARHERDRPACRHIPGAASIPWAQTARRTAP